jgi:tetratricopeptide (TPR) repeat protein
MLGATGALLERWVAVRPDQARPHEESADFALWQRNLDGCSTSPERADSLGALALRHLEMGLALRPDTTAEDLVRLAMLRLSADDLLGAEELVDEALVRFQARAPRNETTGPAVPLSMANLYLATGRPSRAHELLRPIWDQETFGTMDPTEPDGVLMAGPGEPWFGRLRTAGSAGVTGPPLDSLFEAVDRVWAEPGYTSAQRASISHAALQLGIGPALAASPRVLADWSEAWTENDFEVSAALRGLAAVERADSSADRLLAEAVDELGSAERVSVSDLHLVAMLASRTGHDTLAARLFGRVAACPLKLDQVDLGWGLRTQSYVNRGLALRSAGESRAAREAFSEAARLWQEAEPGLDSARSIAVAGRADGD